MPSEELTVRVTSDRIAFMSEQLRAKFQRLVRKTALDIEADAKRLAPVDTGALRSSIQTDLKNNGMTAEVTVGVEYGAYQEFGTAHVPAQPYLTPAVENARAGFETAVEAILQGRE